MTKTATAGRPVLELARSARYWNWVLATMLLRLPPIMAPMAFVLVSMEYNGSPTVGGLLVGVALLPGVIAGPLCGRLLDRIGTEKWTPRLLVLGGAARLLLAVAFVQGAPEWVLIGCVLVGTLITSGVSGATRTLLNATVPRHLIGPALSLDSIAVEIVVITAPFMVALSALADPIYAIIAMGVATLAGAVLLHPRMRRPAPSGPAGPDDASLDGAPPAADQEQAGHNVVTTSGNLWRNRKFVFWVLVTLAFGHLLGTAEVGVLPRVVQDGGDTTDAAILIGMLGAASAVAGFAYAWYGNRVRLSFVRQAAVLLVLMITSVLVIAVTDSYFGLALAFIALGLWTAPLNTVMNEAPGHIVPEKRMTEAFSTLVAAQSIGFAFAGGLLAVVSVEHMLLLGSVTAIVTLAVAPVLLSRRPRERTAPAQSPKEYAR